MIAKINDKKLLKEIKERYPDQVVEVNTLEEFASLMKKKTRVEIKCSSYRVHDSWSTQSKTIRFLIRGDVERGTRLPFKENWIKLDSGGYLYDNPKYVKTEE